ncbi:hypothetical protein Tco_0745112, partial [Tanacetum coccineum]
LISSSVVDSINNLDAGNPLHVQNSDNSNSVIIPFKLLESYATSDVLSAQWDRCNAMVLTWIMNVVSQDVYMGLVYSENAAVCSCDASKELGLHQQLMKLMQFLMGLDDCYHPVRSSLLTRDPLPKVKDAYNVISREESHRGVHESSGGTESKQNATFLCFEIVGFPQGFKRNFNYNSNTGKQSFNVDSDVKMSDKPSSSSQSSSFTSEQIQKLLNLINDKSTRSIHANMAGRASFFNGNI